MSEEVYKAGCLPAPPVLVQLCSSSMEEHATLCRVSGNCSKQTAKRGLVLHDIMFSLKPKQKGTERQSFNLFPPVRTDGTGCYKASREIFFTSEERCIKKYIVVAHGNESYMHQKDSYLISLLLKKEKKIKNPHFFLQISGQTGTIFGKISMEY